MRKVFVSVLVVFFITLLISLPASAAKLVGEEEVKQPDKVQKIEEPQQKNPDFEKSIVTEEVRPSEVKEESPQISKDINKETESGPSAVAVIATLVILIGLIFGGIFLEQHISDKYNYNIFSLGNLFMGCIALILLIVSAFNHGPDLWIYLTAAALIYLVMFIITLRKTSVALAILSVVYQILVSSLIVFVIFYYFFLRKKD